MGGCPITECFRPLLGSVLFHTPNDSQSYLRGTQPKTESPDNSATRKRTSPSKGQNCVSELNSTRTLSRRVIGHLVVECACAREQLPVRRSGRHVEGAGVEQQVTTCGEIHTV